MLLDRAVLATKVVTERHVAAADILLTMSPNIFYIMGIEELINNAALILLMYLIENMRLRGFGGPHPKEEL